MNTRSEQHSVEIGYYTPPAPRPWWHWAILGAITAWTLVASAVVPWVFYRLCKSAFVGL